jgi:hypothetical protein
MRLTVALFAFALALATSTRAEDIAFVESSSELDDGKPATTMWNAVDGKETTAWCTKPGAEAQTAVLSFGFEKAVTVTHIAIVVGAFSATGAMKGEGGLDKTKKRARIVYVADVEHRVEAKFKDDVGVQTLELTPPAKGKRIVVEILGAYEGATPDAPLCVGEVTLKHKNDALTGASIATKLRGLNTPSKKLLHEWLDDVSAPQRTLLMNVDGTFTYRFEPLLEGKPVKLKGKWTATGTGITFDIGGKTTRVAARLTKIEDSGDDHVVELVLSGEAPHPSMAATYRPAPFRLP